MSKPTIIATQQSSDYIITIDPGTRQPTGLRPEIFAYGFGSGMAIPYTLSGPQALTKLQGIVRTGTYVSFDGRQFGGESEFINYVLSL